MDKKETPVLAATAKRPYVAPTVADLGDAVAKTLGGSSGNQAEVFNNLVNWH